MGFYKIADLPLEMHAADTAFFTQRLADYVAPPDEQLCMTLVSKRLPALEAPPGETTFFPHGLRRDSARTKGAAKIFRTNRIA